MSAMTPKCETCGAEGPPRRVLHKRGSTYTVIGVADMQSSGVLPTGAKVVVYRSEVDGRLFARLRDEFNDWRHTDIKPGR